MKPSLVRTVYIIFNTASGIDILYQIKDDDIILLPLDDSRPTFSNPASYTNICYILFILLKTDHKDSDILPIIRNFSSSFRIVYE